VTSRSQAQRSATRLPSHPQQGRSAQKTYLLIYNRTHGTQKPKNYVQNDKITRKSKKSENNMHQTQLISIKLRTQKY